MMASDISLIGKDSDSDIPDDFFDDFSKDEFMSGLEVVDSVDSFDDISNVADPGEVNFRKRPSHKQRNNQSRFGRYDPGKRNADSGHEYHGGQSALNLDMSNEEDLNRRRSKPHHEGSRYSPEPNNRNMKSLRDRRNDSSGPREHSNHHNYRRNRSSVEKGLERRRRSRSQSEQSIFSRTRRDIIKTRRAIEIDKDRKAKDLLAKRIRLVETGLIPPGMEADVVLSKQRSRTPTNVSFDNNKTDDLLLANKIRLERHSGSRRLIDEDDHNMNQERDSRERRYRQRRDRLRRTPRTSASPRSQRLSNSRPLRRSPRNRSRESKSRIPFDSRPSRQRSPFIKEIARKLREYSAERIAMHVVNPPSFAPQNNFVDEPVSLQNNFILDPPPFAGHYDAPYMPPGVQFQEHPLVQESFYPQRQFYPSSFPDPNVPHLSNPFPPQHMFYEPSPTNLTEYANVDSVPTPQPVPKPELQMEAMKKDLTLDDLLAQKKISIADYLKLKVNPKGGSREDNSALKDKIELISRCQNAVKKLSQFHKPNNLVYNPELEDAMENNIENMKFRSPFKNKHNVKYSYTSSLTFDKRHNDKLLNNIIATVGLQGIVKVNKAPPKPIALNMRSVSVQTTLLPCEVCEIRKSLNVSSVGTSTEDLYRTCSVHSQVNEMELQTSKTMYIAGQPGSHNPVSLTHLTPSQILANELAAKARAFRNYGNQGDKSNNNSQRYYQTSQDSDNYSGSNRHSYSLGSKWD